MPPTGWSPISKYLFSHHLGGWLPQNLGDHIAWALSDNLGSRGLERASDLAEIAPPMNTQTFKIGAWTSHILGSFNVALNNPPSPQFSPSRKGQECWFEDINSYQPQNGVCHTGLLVKTKAHSGLFVTGGSCLSQGEGWQLSPGTFPRPTSWTTHLSMSSLKDTD